MSITAEQKTHVINLLRKKYPDWDGFHHQAFRRDEINYKRSTVKKAVSLLSESTLAQLLVTRETNAFIERLERLGQATSLLQRNESDHGDLEILYVPTLDRPVFCAQIYHLLHGTESVNERLLAYLQYIEEHELPNTWTFPTYLLQFCYPNTEFFVEPRPTEWFLKYIGLSPSLGRPTAETYIAIKQFAHSLKQSLAEFMPQDMIDIQSVIHICSAMNEPVLMSSYSDGSSSEEDLFFGNFDGFDALENLEGGDGEQAPEHIAPSVTESNDEPERANFWPDSQDNEDSDPTMLYISEVSDESFTEVPESEHQAISAPVDADYIRNLRSRSLSELYTIFLTSFMASPVGVARAAAYARAREAAEQNFAHLIAEHELGEVVTDRVYLHLLPHADTKASQHSGAWIHPVNAKAEVLLATLNKKYPENSEIREQISQVLLEFIRHCVYKANALEKTSEALARLDAISLINLSSITPILHALKPAQYVLLDEPAVAVINHFGGVSFGNNLQALPDLSAKAFQIIDLLKKDEAASRFSSVHATDLFDMFAYWLVEKQHFFHDLDELEANTPAPEPAPDPKSEYDETATDHPSLEQDAPPTGGHDMSDAIERLPKVQDVPPEAEPEALIIAQSYPLQQCATETGFSETTLDQWNAVLLRKKHLLFYGPAGTGKTFMAQHMARMLVQNTNGLVQLLHLHPGYTYTDFMGEPSDNEGQGFFRTFCVEAARRSGPCVLILDDINRVDIASVFGELLYMMEYREIGFALSNDAPFDIPSNVHIVGTMRPTDSHAVLHDTVVGRRFALVPLAPDYEVLKAYHSTTDFQADGLVRTLTQLNEQIDSFGLQIGITYFLRQDLPDHIEAIWRYEIEPQIEAAFSGDSEKVDAFRWNKVHRRMTR